MKNEGTKVLSFGHDTQMHEDSLLHRNVLESMSEGVLTVAADGRIGILNPAASLLLGLLRTTMAAVDHRKRQKTTAPATWDPR